MHQFQRVEVLRTTLVQVDPRTIAAQIPIEYVVIIVRIMPQQDIVAYIIEKHLQRFVVRILPVVLQFFDNRIHNVAQMRRNLAVGGYKNNKLRTFHYPSFTHFDGCDLHDIIRKNIEPRCLGVEYHDLFFSASSESKKSEGSSPLF